MAETGASVLVVKGKPGEPEAKAEFNGQVFACVIGENGLIDAELKREGDRCTPVGEWKVLYGMYRADRVGKPKGPLTWQVITRDMGWCDASGDSLYNKPCPATYGPSHELMWRENEAYDYVLVLDYNVAAVAGKGSAIFLHIWRKGAEYTAGCVALKPDDLKQVIESVTAVRVE